MRHEARHRAGPHRRRRFDGGHRRRRAHIERTPRRRTRGSRLQLRARAGADRAHRPGGRVPRDHGARRTRCRLPRRGRPDWRVRLHRGRFTRAAAGCARHRPAAIRRVPQPPGRLRAPRADRAREGRPHGALPAGRAAGLRDAAHARAPQRTEAHRCRRAPCSTVTSSSPLGRLATEPGARLPAWRRLPRRGGRHVVRVPRIPPSPHRARSGRPSPARPVRDDRLPGALGRPDAASAARELDVLDHRARSTSRCAGAGTSFARCRARTSRRTSTA